MSLKIFQIDIVANVGINVPEMVDFDHIGLYKKKFTSKGMVNKIEYYTDFEEPNIYSNLIVQTEFTYGFSNNIYTDVSTLVKWYNEENEIGHERSFFRKFLGWESIDFALEKRNNIIGNTKLFVLSQIGLANGFDLLQTIDAQMMLYIQGPVQPLVDAVQQQVGVKPYMTQLLADQICSILIDV